MIMYICLPLNIICLQPELIVAKICGCERRNKQTVVYALSEESHSLCIDKKDILNAEIEACERLLKYLTEQSEKEIVAREIAELKMALDLLP